MRHKATHGKQDAEVDLTPMLDVVFIMLIFFIVTATFVQEAGLDVTKPDDNQETKSSSKSMRIIVTDTNGENFAEDVNININKKSSGPGFIAGIVFIQSAISLVSLVLIIRLRKTKPIDKK